MSYALIETHGGTLERFIGAVLMVLFYDPPPCPDPPVRAVRLAAELRDGMAKLAERWRANGHQLGFSGGIAHGLATIGTVGFDGRRLHCNRHRRGPSLAPLR